MGNIEVEDQVRMRRLTREDRIGEIEVRYT